MNSKAIVNVPFNQVLPDPNQPRKFFNPQRISDLASSIKKHGIISPLVVEKTPEGKYLLIDGERRYRAAETIKLDTLPVVIEEASTSSSDRVIRQFHLQEQHEEWTATEKAIAVEQLAKETGLSVSELAAQLALPRTTVFRYQAFYSLLDRKRFEQKGISLEWARELQRTIDLVARLGQKSDIEPFEQEELRQLENLLVDQIAFGEIRNRNDVTRIRDSFRSSPEIIRPYMKKDVSAARVFAESNAEGERVVRNLFQNASVLVSFVRKAKQQNVTGIIESRGDVKLKALRQQLVEIGEFANLL